MPEGTLIGQLYLVQLDGNKIKNFTPQYLKMDVFEKIEDDLEAIFQKSSLEKMCTSLTNQLERCKTIKEKKIMHVQTNKKSLSESLIIEGVNKILISQFLMNNPKLDTKDVLLEAQNKDNFTKEIAEKMKDNQLVNNKGTFIKYRGLVYKKDNLTNDIRLLIPKYIASDILSRLHMKNHCGLTALTNNFDNMFYCPNSPSLAKDILKKCLTCMLSPRGHLMKVKGAGRTFASTVSPNRVLFADTAYMPKTKDGYCFLMVLADLATGRISALPLKSLTTAASTKAILTYFSIMPTALYLVSDQGPEYGYEFTKALASLNICHRQTKPARSTARSNVERGIRMAKTVILRMCSNKLSTNNWPSLLPLALNALNSTPPYGGKLSRDQLYFNQDIFTQNLCLPVHDIVQRRRLTIKDIAMKRIKNATSKRGILHGEMSSQDRTGAYVLVDLSKGSKNVTINPAKHLYKLTEKIDPFEYRATNLFDGSSKFVTTDRISAISFEQLIALQTNENTQDKIINDIIKAQSTYKHGVYKGFSLMNPDAETFPANTESKDDVDIVNKDDSDTVSKDVNIESNDDANIASKNSSDINSKDNADIASKDDFDIKNKDNTPYIQFVNKNDPANMVTNSTPPQDEISASNNQLIDTNRYNLRSRRKKIFFSKPTQTNRFVLTLHNIEKIAFKEEFEALKTGLKLHNEICQKCQCNECAILPEIEFKTFTRQTCQIIDFPYTSFKNKSKKRVTFNINATEKEKTTLRINFNKILLASYYCTSCSEISLLS